MQILALLGLAFLLLLAGLEVDLSRLTGKLLRIAGAGFVVSMALALGVGFALHAAGLAEAPLFVGSRSRPPRSGS